MFDIRPILFDIRPILFGSATVEKVLAVAIVEEVEEREHLIAIFGVRTYIVSAPSCWSSHPATQMRSRVMMKHFLRNNH